MNNTQYSEKRKVAVISSEEERGIEKLAAEKRKRKGYRRINDYRDIKYTKEIIKLLICTSVVVTLIIGVKASKIDREDIRNLLVTGIGIETIKNDVEELCAQFAGITGELFGG